MHARMEIIVADGRYVNRSLGGCVFSAWPATISGSIFADIHLAIAYVGSHVAWRHLLTERTQTKGTKDTVSIPYNPLTLPTPHQTLFLATPVSKYSPKIFTASIHPSLVTSSVLPPKCGTATTLSSSQSFPYFSIGGGS